MEYQMLEGMNFPPKTRNEVQERMTSFIALNGGDTNATTPFGETKQINKLGSVNRYSGHSASDRIVVM